MGHYKDTEASSTNKYPIICIYGESGSGKTTYAKSLKDDNTIILDGDAIRKYITYDLGYSDIDRYKNNITIAKIAELLYHQGHKVIISTVKANIAYDFLKLRGVETQLIYINENHEIISKGDS